jgi:hypothetical protein
LLFSAEAGMLDTPPDIFRPVGSFKRFLDSMQRRSAQFVALNTSFYYYGWYFKLPAGRQPGDVGQ